MRQAVTTLLIVCVLFLTPVIPGGLAQTPESRSDVQTAIESDSRLSSRARKVLFRCRIRQDDRQWTEAVEIMSGWLADHPDRDHHLLRLNLAISHLQLEQENAALDNLRRAVELEPRFGRAWLRRGETAYGLEHYTEAGDAFVRGFELVPDPQPQVLYYAAVSALLADQPEQALARLEVLLTGYRTNADLGWYQALLVAVAETEDPEQAQPYLNNLLADHPEQPRAWFLAYQFAATQEQYRSAAIYLTITGYLRPLTRNEQIRLGDLYDALDVPVQAARHYEQALVSAEAEEISAQYERLASMWLAAHQYDRARTTLEKALEVRPSVQLWSLLGDLEYLEQDYEKALGSFCRCCELDPTCGRGWLMQGYCALELDRKAEARTYLEKASGFEAQGPSARALLRRISNG